MDTAKLNGFLQELKSGLQPDELDDVELPFDVPHPEKLIEEGADPQFALYSTIQTQLLLMSTILERSGIVDAYHAAVESQLDTYTPGYPPMSPVTDSYFYLWALCDLKFGDDGDNIGRIVLQVLEESGAPAELLTIGRDLVNSRMGIYKTVGDDGDQLVVRELVTNRELLVDAPTGYLGAAGDLRFVRLAPPAADGLVEYCTELTTPYVLTGKSADEWTAYLRGVLPERATTADGTESTNIEDRLAAVFEDDLGRLPWLEFIFQGYRGFEPNVIFLTGLPNDPTSLPHAGPVPDIGSTESKSSTESMSIAISLTDAQRKAAAEVMPQLHDIVKPQTKGRKRIELLVAGWQELSQRTSVQLTWDFGRGRTRLRNLRMAVESALPLNAPPPPPLDIETDTVYQLRIELLHTSPPIWRRIAVPDCSLAEFHAAVQIAMGWTDSHLHEFTIGGKRYSIPDPFGYSDDMGPFDSTNVWLSDVVRNTKTKIGYMYDFGDSWDHLIEVERIASADPASPRARCLDGARQCPPEDCGGVWGYGDLVEILSDPKHDEYDERIEWIGEFDPEEFDAAEHTRELQRYFASVPTLQEKRLGPAQRQKFDIHQDFFEDGDFDDEAFQDYSETIQNQFAESPEFDSLPPGPYGFTDVLLSYGANYLGVTPATMNAGELEEFLFEIVPRKVMIGPEDAESVILELNAFFCFVHREYSISGAEQLARHLTEKTTRRLKKTLGNSSNFGMAKSFFSMGQTAGYDMQSKDDLQEFVADYNSRLPSRSPAVPNDPNPMHHEVTAPIRRTEPRVGRNDPCLCGSGKKYKKCCLGKDG